MAREDVRAARGAGSPRSGGGAPRSPVVVGIYGWRKRFLYLLVLLLMATVVLNLALTVWILKVMSFTVDGMGHLRITDKGLRLEGESEFLHPLYAKEIRSRLDSALLVQSARNVTINSRDQQGQVTGQMVVGPDSVEAKTKRFQVTSSSGKFLFSAEDSEVVVGAERLRVLGAEGALFEHSIQTPQVRAEPFKHLRLESPTRALWLDAPQGVVVQADAGDVRASCRQDLTLESRDGAIVLDSETIRVPNLPRGGGGGPPGQGQRAPEGVHELCACPGGKLYLAAAKAEGGQGCRAAGVVCD
uniref:Delta-sarcoglycan-like n=1 Tax=Petromyzon marinus TaxID=7757 RepID=A0AAJ7UAM3_PETMA|nr:delta-sarcoglycan-like [Petromyzon marinus]XP_032832933.1 delta-sarcoglycan-like [Petromyzon marinus]